MDRALRLLLRLRLRGFVRRWVRSLRTPKGLLLALVSSLLFLPWAIVSLFSPRIQLDAQLELIRRHGALGLLAFCALNVILSSEERAVYFSPAEVDFLFSGPFPRRQLLMYRMLGEAFSSLLTSLLLTFLLAHHANTFLPAFVGLFLMVELMVLVSLATGLFISTVGALAFNRQRKLLLLALVAVAGIALVPIGREALAMDFWQLLDRLEHSRVMRVVTWPFRPPIMAFASKRAWPDLAAWTLLGLGILGALAAAILALNAEHYEATAAASAKTYARLRATRLGKSASRPLKTRLVLPQLPWWRGIGPNLWRQSMTAMRHPDRFAVLMVYLLCPLGPLLLLGRSVEAPVPVDLRLTLLVVASMSLTASLIVGSDFRSDIDRMDLLKSLPIGGPALVVSQLGVPVLLLTLVQATCLVLMAGIRGDTSYLFESLAFLPSFDMLLAETEAVLLLWFPVRIVPGATLDFTVMGRQMLLLFAKLVMVGIAAGLAAGLGAVVFLFLVPSWGASLAVAWSALTAVDLALIPLVVLAFHQYDVARDCPP
jgi:hypothetical protein